MQRISGLCSAFLIALIAASCGGGDSTGVGGGGGGGGGGGSCPANTFCMASTTYTPASRTVTAGTTVTWNNQSGTTHNVTWDNATGRTNAGAGDGVGDIGDFS